MRGFRLVFIALSALGVVAVAVPAGASEVVWRVMTFWRDHDGPLSQPMAARAVREALDLVATRALDRLSRPGGFAPSLTEAALPLPDDLADAQATLAAVGRSKELDDLQLKLNQAAEIAVSRLRAPLAAEIDNLVLTDALALVRGQPDSATRFLRVRSEAKLIAAITPAMARALEAAGAGTMVDAAARAARAPNRADDWREALTAYAARAAVAHVFDTMAREEAALRSNPALRTSEDLRKAFAGA